MREREYERETTRMSIRENDNSAESFREREGMIR